MVKHMSRVKQTGNDIIKEARKCLKSALSEIPFVEIKEIKSNVRLDKREVDLIVKVLVSGKPAKFIVEVKSQGEPRMTRMAAAQINSFIKDYTDSYGIFIAPYLSDASRLICKEAGISIGLVSKVKKALLEKEWIKEKKRKFYLVKPEEVLNEWVN